MKIKLTLVAVIFCFSIGNLSSQNTLNNTKISALETAEIEKKIELIDQLFHDEAIILHPDGLPIVGKNAVLALYEFIWSNTQIETLNYEVEKAYKQGNSLVEEGQYTFKSSNQVENTFPFKATYVEANGAFKLKEISVGNNVTMVSKLPEMIKPTGNHKIGQATFFYDKKSSGNGRYLSFQLWYPAIPKSEIKVKYQSTHVVQASAEFLQWPLFMNSYLALLESNSHLDASVIPNQKFPVVIYNHGYGGFSNVYQSVCEDLASNGYIVASIGHQNESALLLVDQEIVISNSRENEIYASRAAELNGSQINSLQGIILNSNDDKEIERAYLDLIKLSPLHNESTRLWTSDNKMLIEKLKHLNKNDTRLRGSLDLTKIGVFGHSIGGATAGQLAFDCEDIKAGINLDGFQFGDLVNNNLKVPFMFVSSNASGNSYLRVSNFRSMSEAKVHHAVIEGFSHESFRDIELFKPKGEEIIKPQRDLIRLFFNKYLKDKQMRFEKLNEKYPNIIFKY